MPGDLPELRPQAGPVVSGRGQLRVIPWTLVALVAVLLVVAAAIAIGHHAAARRPASIRGISSLKGGSLHCGSRGPVAIADTRAANAQQRVFVVHESRGVILVGIESLDFEHKTTSFTIHAFTTACAPDERFGLHGTERLALPAPSKGGQVDLDVMTPAPGGTTLLGGSTGGAWLVGRLRADGAVDRSFGDGGWSTATPRFAHQGGFAPEVSALLPLSAGQIIEGGDDGNAHCCVQTWVQSLSGSGHVNASYGNGGARQVFSAGASLGQLLTGPHGAIIASGSEVFGGCGGPVFALLSPSGTLEGAFSAALEQTPVLGFRQSYLVGAPVDGTGGRLVFAGFTQRSCVHATSSHYGFVTAFTSTGRTDPTFTTTHFAIADTPDVVEALPLSGGKVAVLMEVAGNTTPFRTGVIVIKEFSATGHPESHFGAADTDELKLVTTHGMLIDLPLVAGTGGGDTVVAVVPSARGLELLSFGASS